MKIKDLEQDLRQFDMKFITDEGVVLKKYDTGEKDEVVVLFTKHHGKMAFVARGSRDPKSRKAGALQLFNTIAFQARQGRGKLPYLEQVKSLKSRSFHIVGDSQTLDEYYRASEILKLTDHFLHESQIAGAVFDDLNEALDLIQSSTVSIIYWIRLLQDAGFIPDWSVCSVCHEALVLKEEIIFSTENKGFSHQACSSLTLKKVDPNVLKLMSFFQKADISDSIRVEVSEGMLDEVKNYLKEISELKIS